VTAAQDGKSALTIAMTNGYQSICDELRRYGASEPEQPADMVGFVDIASSALMTINDSVARMSSQATPSVSPLRLLRVITQVEAAHITNPALTTPRNKLIHFFNPSDRSTTVNSLQSILATFADRLANAGIVINGAEAEELGSPTDEDVLDMLAYITMMLEPHCGLGHWSYSHDHTNGLDRKDASYPAGTDEQPAFTDSDRMRAVLSDAGLPSTIQELRAAVDSVYPVSTARADRPVLNQCRTAYCNRDETMQDLINFIDAAVLSDAVQAHMIQRGGNIPATTTTDPTGRGYLFDEVKRVVYGGSQRQMVVAMLEATGRSQTSHRTITSTARLLKEVAEVLKLREAAHCSTLAERRQFMRLLLATLPGWAQLPTRFAQDFDGALYSRTRSIGWRLDHNADFGGLVAECLAVARSQEFLDRCREVLAPSTLS
jgi:hypothetical protein